jgi:hypothetical protein
MRHSLALIGLWACSCGSIYGTVPSSKPHGIVRSGHRDTVLFGVEGFPDSNAGYEALRLSPGKHTFKLSWGWNNQITPMTLTVKEGVEYCVGFPIVGGEMRLDMAPVVYSEKAIEGYR